MLGGRSPNQEEVSSAECGEWGVQRGGRLKGTSKTMWGCCLQISLVNIQVFIIFYTWKPIKQRSVCSNKKFSFFKKVEAIFTVNQQEVTLQEGIGEMQEHLWKERMHHQLMAQFHFFHLGKMFFPEQRVAAVLCGAKKYMPPYKGSVMGQNLILW